MNRTHALVPPLMAVCCVLAPLDCVAEDYGDWAIGRDLARDICADCHGVESGDLQSPNDMAPLFREVANQPSTTRMSLTVWMGSTHPTMPNIKLSAADTDHIVSYILNLRDRSGG